MFVFDFVDFPSATFGEKLRGQVEERLYFYETGKTPRRNIEVMQEALKEVQEEQGKWVVSTVLRDWCSFLFKIFVLSCKDEL